MKKYIAGFIAGIVFMVSASAFADTISLVGKKVTGEYDIVIDNKNLPEKGAIIDSKANVPVRALSEALGADVKVEGKTIFITSDVIDNSPKEDAVTNSVDTQIEPPQSNRPIKAIEGDIKNIQDKITSDKIALEFLEQKNKSNSDASYQEKIDILNKSISESEAKLESLKAELAELEK
ncbi:hypothetical protein D3C74_151280 [compost metagenome]